MKSLGILSVTLLWALLGDSFVEADKSSEVKLSLNEFEELFSKARLEEAERRLFDQSKMLEAEHRQKLAELEQMAVQSDSEATQQLLKLFPNNYHVLRCTASGLFNQSSSDAGVEHDVASFDHELILRVMEPQWTEIPIVNMNATVASNWDVTWASDEDSDMNDFHVLVDPVRTPDAMLILKDAQKVLATNRSGLFKIKFRAFARVGKNKNRNQISMSNLLYPLSGLSLRVVTGSETSSVKDFSVEPNTAVLRVDPLDEYTDVEVNLPLTTDSIKINWLDASLEETRQAGYQGEESQKSELNKGDSPQQITAISEVLHSIGEGIVRSFFMLEYTTTSENSSLNTVEFTIHGEQGLRITSLDGHALQHWEANDINNTSVRVRVVFKSSHMDSTVALLVHTEMPSASQVELPRINCANALRQVGHVAVVKDDANVEVHEHSKTSLTPCEPIDVSSKLRLNIDQPIVLSYKYLNPDNSLVLDVKEHVAMAADQTLEAAIDRVHYKAVVTETHTMHSLILLLQSTKLQYLEVLGLPSTVSMFTLLVNSVPAKPVGGGAGEHSVLVPLLIGLNSEEANKGSSMYTSVELEYISTHDSLGRNGTLSLTPPQFNLPISVETTHLRLPEQFDYDFSSEGFIGPDKRLMFPIPASFSYKTGKRVVEEDYEFSLIDDIMSEKDNKQKTASVKIVTPNIGTSFHFHRLVVVDSEQMLDASYSETTQEKVPWWSWLGFAGKQ